MKTVVAVVLLLCPLAFDDMKDAAGINVSASWAEASQCAPRALDTGAGASINATGNTE